MRLVVRMVLALGLLVIITSAVYACSCEIPDRSKAFKQAKAIFIGQVIEINQVKYQEDKPDGLFYAYTIKFKVERYWKGNKTSEVVVLSDQGLLPCHTSKFIVGKRYLVYAYGKKLLAPINCNRSRAVEDASEDLEKLGKGREPLHTTSRPTEH
jgi:hypothetical protein